MKIEFVISLSSQLMDALFGGKSRHDVTEQKLDHIIAQLQELKEMTAETQALLNQIDETTNAIAANVTSISNTTATIGTEVDALVAQTDDSALKAKLTDISSRLSTVSSAGAAQVEVLNAIAAKGAPVVPPVPEVVA